MLVLLLATCMQTKVALEAAANALDTDLTSVLAATIERTEAELAALVEKIEPPSVTSRSTVRGGATSSISPCAGAATAGSIPRPRT